MSRKLLSVCLLVAVIVSLATLACGILPERQLQPTPIPPATPLPPDAPVHLCLPLRRCLAQFSGQCLGR